MRWIKFYGINLIAGCICHLQGLEENFQTGYILGAIFMASIHICFVQE